VTGSKVFIALPAYGQINAAQTTSALMGLNRLLVVNGMDGGFGTLSFPDIEEIRNIFASIWYDTIKGASHLLFIDSDMGFDPQIVIDMVMLDKPLVGALCPKRKIPVEFAGRAKPGPVKVVSSISHPHAFMEVDGVGGAIMLIRRDAMDAVLGKYPELIDEISIKNHAAKDMLDKQGVKRLLRVFDKIVINGEKFSEDLSFCMRWREAAPEQWRQTEDGKGEIWANISYSISHVGPHEFTGRYLDEIQHLLRQVGEPAPALPMAAEPDLPPLEAMAGLMQAAE